MLLTQVQTSDTPKKGEARTTLGNGFNSKIEFHQIDIDWNDF